MEMRELELLRVPDLGERVSRAGLRWWHLLGVDGAIPNRRSEHACNRAGEILDRRLMAVHGRGGLGRTGIVAARLLVEFGEEAESAPLRVRRAWAGTVENWIQEECVRDLVDELGVF